MNDLLDWLAIAAACLMGASVLVAGWEHLAREAAEATRMHPGSRHRPQPRTVAAATVDVPLHALTAVRGQGAAAEGCASADDGSASHAAMAAALTRAAAIRPPRDSSPWLDTCPQVTIGVGEQPQAVAPSTAAAPGAGPAPFPVLVPIPDPAPALGPASTMLQSTIERAALR